MHFFFCLFVFTASAFNIITWIHLKNDNWHLHHIIILILTYLPCNPDVADVGLSRFKIFYVFACKYVS